MVDEKQRQIEESLVDRDGQLIHEKFIDFNDFELELDPASPISMFENEEAETKGGFSSFENSDISIKSHESMSKQDCLKILYLIKSVKLE